MPAAGVATIAAFQMKGLGEHHVWAIEVVVLVFERRCTGCNVWRCRVHRTILSKSKPSCWSCDWCFTKPRNYLQISTDIFIFDQGWYPDPSNLGCPGPSGLGSPVFIVRHSGLIICKVGGFILKWCREKSACRRLVHGCYSQKPAEPVYSRSDRIGSSFCVADSCQTVSSTQ